jgi:two-component system CheB/CheR fusion protein
MADKSFFIVGIGASTGGLEALKIIFASIKHDCENMAFVVAQHVSPTHKSMLVKLLQKETTLSVSEATHNQIIKPASIYITPPNHQVSVVNGERRLKKSLVL